MLFSVVEDNLAKLGHCAHCFRAIDIVFEVDHCDDGDSGDDDYDYEINKQVFLPFVHFRYYVNAAGIALRLRKGY